MILFFCKSCMNALRVLGDMKLVHSLTKEENARCPFCSTEMEHALEEQIDGNDKLAYMFYDLTYNEAFCALMGGGMPSEKEVSHERVLEELRKGVIHVSTEEKPGAALVITAIQVADKTILRFGSSPAGAVIYKIVCPKE